MAFSKEDMEKIIAEVSTEYGQELADNVIEAYDNGVLDTDAYTDDELTQNAVDESVADSYTI